MNQLLKREETRESNGATRMQFLTPLANIIETKDGYILEAEMPGVRKDGLEVTVENGQLTIIGRRNAYAGPGQAIYRESRDHDYRRVFEIDSSIDTAKVSARMEQGLLTLHLPKAEAVKPRKITVSD